MVEEVILPKLGQTMEEGTIVEWLKREGDPVQRGEILFIVESDKATLEVEASTKGFLRKILAFEGETAPVLSPVALITETADGDISPYAGAQPEEAEPPAEAEAAEAERTVPAPPTPEEAERERIFASPRARRRAREEGVDLTQVTGSGPNDRIVERDVEAYLKSLPKVPPVEEVQAIAEAPMRGVRARIARHMHQSHLTTAPVTLTTEVDATAFVEVRERMKGSLAEELGFNIGYNDLLIKLVAHALREFPYMNAQMEETDDGGAVIRHLDDVHVALAVDTERGLLVPVVRHADQKGITEIGRQLRELVERARSDKATPDEMSGSTFTITNLGMYDIDAFTPIINLPEAAILGVGRIEARPAAVDGKLSIQQRMWLSLTFDHRLVDGAPAARFLQRVKQLIKEPYLLLA